MTQIERRLLSCRGHVLRHEAASRSDCRQSHRYVDEENHAPSEAEEIQRQQRASGQLRARSRNTGNEGKGAKCLAASFVVEAHLNDRAHSMVNNNLSPMQINALQPHQARNTMQNTMTH